MGVPGSLPDERSSGAGSASNRDPDGGETRRGALGNFLTVRKAVFDVQPDGILGVLHGFLVGISVERRWPAGAPHERPLLVWVRNKLSQTRTINFPFSSQFGQNGSVTDKSEPIHLDASTFQQQLGELANTLALKVEREGPRRIPTPTFVSVDIFVLLRQASHTYDLFFFLNADERRHKDVQWRAAYSVASLPLIRCMIDCLYNITAILENPGVKAYQFRESGYRRALEALDADEQRYGGNERWDSFIGNRRELLRFAIQQDALRIDQIRAAKAWPTLGAYLRPKKNVPLTGHQKFLKKLTYGFWQEYSAMAHGTFDGLMVTAMFYTTKDVPHEYRPRVDVAFERMIFMHLGRMAAVLLCMLTEVQAYFRFEGARINQRLHQVWDALRPVPEIKELYDERYDKLMKDKGINPE